MKNLYDAFVNHILKTEDCTVFLTNGVKLSGVISRTDGGCITLQRDGITQLIMRHAIATIMPHDEFTMDEIETGPNLRLREPDDVEVGSF